MLTNKGWSGNKKKMSGLIKKKNGLRCSDKFIIYLKTLTFTMT